MKIFALKLNQLAFLIIVFLVSLLLFLNLGKLLSDRDTIYLAIAGPTGGENTSGIEMVQGAQLYLNKLNH
ncbi:MAG: hypothetical protein ACFCAD_16240, partial [Pleurocapsa sp.]